MSSGFTLWHIQPLGPSGHLVQGLRSLTRGACQKAAGSSGQTRSRCTNAEEPTEGEERSSEWRRWVLAVPWCRVGGAVAASLDRHWLGGDIIERCPQVATLPTAPLEHPSWGWCPPEPSRTTEEPTESSQRRQRPESAKLRCFVVDHPHPHPHLHAGPVRNRSE